MPVPAGASATSRHADLLIDVVRRRVILIIQIPVPTGASHSVRDVLLVRGSYI